MALSLLARLFRFPLARLLAHVGKGIPPPSGTADAQIQIFGSSPKSTGIIEKFSALRRFSGLWWGVLGFF